jgi:hypothetical protein
MFGGYDKASFTLLGEVDVLAEYKEILGRDIAIYDGLGIQVWEGFVNAVTISFGQAEYRGGPLMDVVNRVQLRYTTPRFGVNPPTGGIEKETGFFMSSGAKGTISRVRFGTLSEIIIPPRPLTDSEAAEIGLELAEELALPKAQVVITGSDAGEPKATIECLGYIHLMKKVVVNYYGVDGEAPPQPATEVLAYPFDVETKGFFSLSGVIHQREAPALRLYNDKAESAHAFLESQHEVVNAYQGGKYVLGVYNNRTVHISRSVPGVLPDIQLSVRGGLVGAVDYNGVTARPGMYARIVDVPFALSPTDPLSFMIDNVEYSGGKLSFNANTFSAIDEALRKRGI